MARKDLVVRVDRTRFDQVARILVDEVRAKNFPFNKMWLPQNATPEEFKKDPLVLSRAIFLANLFMRGMVQSNYIYGQVMKLCQVRPQLMDPAFLSQPHIDEQYVFDCIAPFVKYRLFEMPGIVLRGQRRLYEDWGGDPRKLVEGLDDPKVRAEMKAKGDTVSKMLHRRMVNIEQIKKKDLHPEQMRGFEGVREKITNLFPYFMRSLELLDPNGIMEPAFDLHAIRTFTATKSLIFEGTGIPRFEDVTRIGSLEAERFCIENNVPTNTLADGYWWHSKAMCGRAPGNKTIRLTKWEDPNKEDRHQLGYKPRKRKKVELKMHEPDWSSPRDVRLYELSCGKCALADLCEFNFSSGFYGNEGTIKTQPRTKPPPHLFHNGHGGLPHQTSGKPKPPDAPKIEREALPILSGLGELKEHRRPPKVLPTKEE